MKFDEVQALSHRTSASYTRYLNDKSSLSDQKNRSDLIGGNNLCCAAPVLQSEISMLVRQLNDARDSNHFLKKQMVQLQDTVRMQEIKIRKL